MIESVLQKKINKAIKLALIHRALLIEIREEFIKRTGADYNIYDCDGIIDAIECGIGNLTVQGAISELEHRIKERQPHHL